MNITLNKKYLKKVFILEDNEARIIWFKNIFKGVEKVFITKQTGTALEELSSTKYDVIFLDHDLEDTAYDAFAGGREPQKELTGLYVAEGLKDTVNKNAPCIVHSINPVGAEKMVKANPCNSIHVPFSILMNTMEVK